MVFSGNAPKLADWNWYNDWDKDLFQSHFYYLLIGAHPAEGSEACAQGFCAGVATGEWSIKIIIFSVGTIFVIVCSFKIVPGACTMK